MLPDNHLDFITKIDQEFINTMTTLRKQFIDLDYVLRGMSILEEAKKEGVSRCLSLARTKLEEALHYGIKSLCIMGELKD